MSFKDRKILTYHLIQTGNGTHYFDVKYTGEWTDRALINCIDMSLLEPNEEEYEHYKSNLSMNYGGNVTVMHEDKESGIKRARVAVYYD